MTNTELLEEKITQSGIKKTHLAKKLGLSLAGFRNCCINKAEFKASQVHTLCEELHIDLEEMKVIFFAKSGS